MKIEQARELAAQLWCKPEHKNKVMDVELAESIAQLLVAQTSPEASRKHIGEAFDADPELREAYKSSVSTRLEAVARRRLAQPECDSVASRIVKLFFED